MGGNFSISRFWQSEYKSAPCCPRFFFILRPLQKQTLLVLGPITHSMMMNYLWVLKSIFQDGSRTLYTRFPTLLRYKTRETFILQPINIWWTLAMPNLLLSTIPFPLKSLPRIQPLNFLLELNKKKQLEIKNKK